MALGAAVASALALLDRFDFGEAGWVFDLFVHFSRHLAVMAFVVAVVSGVLRMWRPAALASAVAAFNLAFMLGVSGFATPRAAPAGAVLIRVVSANVHGSETALGKLAVLARDYGADVVSVYEAPDLSDEAAEALFPGSATVRLARKSPDGRDISKRMLFAARKTTAQIAMMPYGRSNRVILRFKIPVAGREVRIITAHPVSPDSPAGMKDRNRLLSQLGDGLDETSPFIVMGDLNTTPWSRIFGAVPGTRAGDPRFESSFPAFAPFLGIPIDHIMFGGELALAEYHVGPDIGSDHRPLFATFELPAPQR